MPKSRLLSICFFLCFVKGSAQDSLTVKQYKSVMFFNEYVFYSPIYTFTHTYQTDDGQIWYGTGTYEDKGRKRILSFTDPEVNFKPAYLDVHYEANFERVLIRCKKGFKSEDFYNTSNKKKVLFVPYKKEVRKKPVYDTLNVEERMSKYPFNKAKKVALVSFNLDYDAELIITRIGEPEPEIVPNVELSRILNKETLPGFAQFKVLDQKQIALLSDILYNACAKDEDPQYKTLGCYNPRNAILFYDADNHVFEYLELCFECRGNKTGTPEFNNFDPLCGFAYATFKLYFESLGLETNKRE